MCAKLYGRGGKMRSFCEEVELELETPGAEGHELRSQVSIRLLRSHCLFWPPPDVELIQWDNRLF